MGGNRQVSYPHTDRRGSTVALGQAGQAVATYAYDEYGRGRAQDGVTGYPFRYTGQRLDPWTGTYHYKAREYAPQLGRFLQPDPARFVDGPNVYAYVGNNPWNATDPTGMQEGNADEARNPSVLRANRLTREQFLELERELSDRVERSVVGAVSGNRARTVDEYVSGVGRELAGFCLEGPCAAPGMGTGARAFLGIGAVERTVGPSLAERGMGLAERWGWNRTDITRGTSRYRIDLYGRSHASVPTPHVQEYRYVVIPRGRLAGQGSWQRVGRIRDATHEELNWAADMITAAGL